MENDCDPPEGGSDAGFCVRRCANAWNGWDSPCTDPVRPFAARERQILAWMQSRSAFAGVQFMDGFENAKGTASRSQI